MSQRNNNSLSRNEIRAREQRKIRWNGKNKHGSYEAYDEAIRKRKFERDQQKAARKRAEENGEFLPVKSGRVTKNLKINTKTDYSVRGGAFAALFSYEDESDDETPVVSVTPTVAPTAPIKNKRSYAEVMTPTLNKSNNKQEPKRKLTWVEMCESDDE
tara:strand:- start:2 stop:475 length:474 start_codon:yes stop_codon:yes gene_type:complete